MITMRRYPLARGGIFATIQGEGFLLGRPMTFIRLAGCSVGCPQCDTDYAVAERCTVKEICGRVDSINNFAHRDDRQIWLTGGEPTDHDLLELLIAIRSCGATTLATSGIRPIDTLRPHLRHISVSPHGKPLDLKVDTADQINLVPGLNGLNLSDWRHFDFSGFTHRWVTPLSKDQIPECLDFVSKHDGFSLGVQAHKIWGLA